MIHLEKPTSGSGGPRANRPLAFYYLATPLFLVGDFLLGCNVRVTFLAAAPALRIFYYAVCFGCGLLSISRYRRFLPLAGLVECTLNIVLLVLSIMIPVINLPALVFAGGAIGLPFTTTFFVNFVISTVFFLYAFYGNPIVRGSPRLSRY